MRYSRPIWYFHLISNNGNYVTWIDYSKLSKAEKDVIKYDKDYSSKIISDFDASYQAIMKGIIKGKRKNVEIYDLDILAGDIYRFIRKYYNLTWLFLVFFQRLLFFFNPLSELMGLWHTRMVKRSNLFNNHYTYDNYSDNYSDLVESNPLVSIIIPTYNRYESLKYLLNNIEKQSYTNFEVIIIDQSEDYNDEVYSEINFKYEIIKQEEPALWKARNKGIRSANSEYLLFLDDDSIISIDWVLEHVKCLDFFKADISCGVSKSIVGAKVPDNYNFFRLSDQLDTGNVMIKKKVFKECGLFDTNFEKMRMGDGEFGVRAYLNGFRIISNPRAYRKHLKLSTGGLRSFGHWDAFRSKLFLSGRPIPSVLYYWRKYWGDEAALLSCITTIPFTLLPYKYKRFNGNLFVSFILFILFIPIIILQVNYSWIKSTKMIKKGAVIEKI